VAYRARGRGGYATVRHAASLSDRLLEGALPHATRSLRKNIINHCAYCKQWLGQRAVCVLEKQQKLHASHDVMSSRKIFDAYNASRVIASVHKLPVIFVAGNLPVSYKKVTGKHVTYR